MSNSDNGKPTSLGKITPGQPRNMVEVAEAAKQLYGTGRKFEGVKVICDGMLLLSDGVKRGFMDHDANSKLISELIEQNVKYNDRITALEAAIAELKASRDGA